MNVQQEIIDSIQTLVDANIKKTCSIITFGIVVSIEASNQCKVKLQDIDYTVAFYGATPPSINKKYPVFIPSGRMNLAFILTGGEGGEEGTYDYNALENKPSINGISLIGNQTSKSLNLPFIKYNTTANWNNQPSLMSELNTIYIYEDYYDLGDNKKSPAIKIGDGKAYLIDLPFTDSGVIKLLNDHISNHVVHITEVERRSWNNKVTCYLEGTDNLVFTTEDIWI